MTDWDPELEEREKIIQAFCELAGCPRFTRLIRRGHDRELATYYLQLADGRLVTIGSVDKLWSPTEFGKAVFAATDIVIKRLTLDKWQNAIGALATTIETQADDEAISDWVSRYLPTTNSRADRDTAAAAREPFIEDGRQHIHPEHFATFIRREVGEQIRLKDVRALLEELGYQPVKVNYSPDGTRSSRTSARYMRGPAEWSQGVSNNGHGDSAESPDVTGDTALWSQESAPQRGP